LCHPVFAVELLHNAINPADYRRLRADLDAGFDWLWPDRQTGEIAVRMQQRMATSAPCAHRVKTADLLIAALAVQHGAGVLHCDAHYDLILASCGESFRSEWLVDRSDPETSTDATARPRKAYAKALGQRMIQFQDDLDLVVWPELIAWLDDQLTLRGLDVPPPPDVAV